MKNKPDAGRPDAQPTDAPFEPELEDTAAQRQRGVDLPDRRGSGGYNPYDAPPGSEQATPSAHGTDLRKLSEWIRVRREVEAQKAAQAAQKDKDRK